MTQCSLGHQLAWHMFVDRHVCIHPSSPPRLGKAKGCWTLNGKALQRNALVRNICMSDSSAWNSGGVACSSPATHWETLSTAEWVQQAVTEAAFRESFGESPRVLGMWARTLLWVTAWLIWFCLFTRIYKNTWFHCFFFFLLAGLVEVHSVYSAARLISCRDAFLHVSTHCWHLLASV